MGNPPRRQGKGWVRERPPASHYQVLPSEGKLSPGEDASYPVTAARCFPDPSLPVLLLPGNDKGKGGRLLPLSQGTDPASRLCLLPGRALLPREQNLLCWNAPACSESQG